MNVLYASLCYPPSLGGGEIHLHCIARQVKRRGNGVRVVNQWSRSRRDWLLGSTLNCDPPHRYVHEGIPVSQLGFDLLTRFRMLPWVMTYRCSEGRQRKRAIREIARAMYSDFSKAAAGPTDLVHSIRIGCQFLPRAALDHARRLDVPFVMTSLHHPGWVGIRHWHYAELYQAADAVIALTDYERDVLIRDKGVHPDRIHVTGIGPVLADAYCTQSFRARFGLERPYVLFLGRKVAHKGWATVLGAAPLVFEHIPDLALVFIGEDTPNSKAALASTDDRIRNLGPVDLETKTAALAGCELLCMPSTGESFGGVYTEAWAMGKPVIGGKIPSLEHVIDDGIDGLLVHQEPRAVADAIIQLLTDPEGARQMGDAGRRKVAERYTWDRLADATIRVYEEVLQRPLPLGEATAASIQRTR